MIIDELFDVLLVLCEAPLPRTVDACTLTMMSKMLIDFEAVVTVVTSVVTSVVTRLDVACTVTSSRRL